MIGIILDAVLQETKAFIQSEDKGGQVMLKTNFKGIKNIPDKTMPFVLLGLNDAPDTYQFPGGLTMLGWKWSFNSYSYEPDAYVDDNTGYSTGLLYDPIDTIRRHFSIGGLGNGLIFPTGQLTPGIVYQVQLGAITYNGNILAIGTYFTCNDTVTTFTTASAGYCVGTSWLTQAMVNILNDYAFQFTLNGITTADQIDDSGLIMGYKIDFESVALDNKTLFTEQDIILETVTQVDPDEPVS